MAFETKATPILSTGGASADRRGRRQNYGLVDFRVGEGFVLALVPADAAEDAEVLCVSCSLFQPKPYFTALKCVCFVMSGVGSVPLR